MAGQRRSGAGECCSRLSQARRYSARLHISTFWLCPVLCQEALVDESFRSAQKEGGLTVGSSVPRRRHRIGLWREKGQFNGRRAAVAGAVRSELDFQSKGSRSAALVYSVISRALLALATARGVSSQTRRQTRQTLEICQPLQGFRSWQLLRGDVTPRDDVPHPAQLHPTSQ
jgi:hypothetical protein